MTVTQDDLLMTDEDFMVEFFGEEYSPEGVLRQASDRANWDSFWADARTTRETSEHLNPVDGDDAETILLKRKLKARADDIIRRFEAAGYERLAHGEKATQVSPELRSYVGRFEQIYERIVNSETVRIAQSLFGPERLDPIDIRVSEYHFAEQAPTLRSDTDPVIKHPRSVTQISFDLVFAGAAAINLEWRPLLANLLASPITTVESPFLTAALINHYSTPEIEHEIRRRVILKGKREGLVDEFEKFTAQATSAFENVIELIENNDTILEYYTQLVRSKADRTGAVAEAVQATEQENLPDIGVPIAVVLQDVVVSSDPETPNTLHVRLNFLRFNSTAFGIYGIEWRDGNGNRTSDIMRCTLLKRYAEWAFLSPGTTDRQTYLEEYRAHLLGDTPDFRCSWQDVHRPDVTRVLETGSFVVSAIQASISMKLAPLHPIGSRYPVVQLLGKHNLRARVVIQTTDRKAMREIATMKDHLDEIGRGSNGPFHDEKVDIQNSVLNSLGAKSFVITACEISAMPETSNGIQVELGLVQSEYNYKAYEALLLEDNTVPDKAIRKVWGRLWDLYESWRQKGDGRIGNRDGPTAEEALAAELLFGKDPAPSPYIPPTDRPGLITPSAIVAAMMRLVGGKVYNRDEVAAQTYRRYFVAGEGALGIDPDANNTYPDMAGSAVFDVRGAPDQIRVAHDLGEVLRQILVGTGNVFSNVPGQSRGDWGPELRYLIDTPFRKNVGIRREIWDSILEVLLDPRDAPAAVKRASIKNPEFERHKRAYNEVHLERGFLNLQWLFTSNEVRRFGVDLSEFLTMDDERLKLLGVDSPEKNRRLVSNYPDLPLPTYADMFPSRGAFAPREESVQDPLDSSRTIPLWTRFAPTYSDLGILPPTPASGNYKEELYRLARDKNHVMEPGFWFHHERLRPGQLQRATNGLKLRPQAEIVQSISVNVNTEQLLTLEEGARRNTLMELIQEKLQEDDQLRRAVEQGQARGTYFDVIDNNGCVVADFVPKDRTAVGGEYDVVQRKIGPKTYVRSLGAAWERADAGMQQANFARGLRSVPDNTFSLVRSYPCFRLYFVEWDDLENREEVTRLPAKGRIVRMIDDLYTTNAILGVTITDSKDQAPLAEVRVSNALGNFDNDSFLLNEERDKILGGHDDAGEDFLGRMRLQTGTGIVIKMGYSSDVNGLKTIFTGQITEIQPGRVVTFLAQGYKVELDQEVAFTEETGNPRKAIEKLLRVGSTKKNMTPHLGRVYDTRDLKADALREIYGGVRLGTTGVLGIQGPGGFLARTFGYVANTVTRNVWFESDEGATGFLDQLFTDVILEGGIGGGWDVLGLTRADMEYHFYGQTAWSGLQEMTRHIPGTVVAVRPFDNEATCFFGWPDQPYRFRTPKALEAWRWDTIAKTRRVEAILGLEREILMEFWTSEYGTLHEELTKKHAAEATAIGGSRIGEFPTAAERGFFDFVSSYQRGSTLGLGRNRQGFHAGYLDALSKSYTGFVRWAQSVPKYHTGISDLDDGNAAMTEDYRFIPIFESLSYDFKPDWELIQSNNPNLGRFLFGYFFGLKQQGGWPGGMEARWQALVDLGMAPLRNANGAQTDAWNQFRASLTGGDLEGAGSAGFDSRYQDVQDRFFQDPAGSLDEFRTALDDLVRGGVISEAERARRLAGFERALSARDAETANRIQAELLGVRRVSQGSGSIGSVLFASWPYFRLFVHYFASWMRNEPDKSDLHKGDVQKNLNELQDFLLPPWFKPMREQHVVFAQSDILDNTIVATTEFMANTVLVRAPGKRLSAPDEVYGAEGSRSYQVGSDWKSWPVDAEGLPIHPHLRQSSRKLSVEVEPNANTPHKASACLLTNLARNIRPMYRGELKIVGRVVHPWDVVLVHDEYNDMYGPIEVDRVTHEFSAETGWVTTIVPHTYCHANNPWALWNLSQTANAMGSLGTIIDVLFVASLFFTGVGIIGGLARAGTLAVRAAGRGAVKKFAVDRGLAPLVGTADIVAETAATSAAAVVKESTRGAVARGLIRSAGRAAGGSVRWLGANWWDVGKRVGPVFLGFTGGKALMDPIMDIAYGLSIKSRINDMGVPVDVRVLTHRGFPLTAGLDLTDEMVIPFGERAAGVFQDVIHGLGSLLGELDEAQPGSVLMSDTAREGN